MATSGSKNGNTLPTKEAILNFVTEAESKVGKREIARAFGIKGPAKIALKRILREMAEEGLLSHPRKRMKQPGKLPSVAILEVYGRDNDGEYLARPVKWDEDEEGPAPRLLVVEKKSRRSPNPVGIGDRILSRISKLDDENKVEGIYYQAIPIRKLEEKYPPQLGILRRLDNGKARVSPIDKKANYDLDIVEGDTKKAEDGDLIRYEVLSKKRDGQNQARLLEVLGNPNDEKKISLIAIHNHGIPDHFPDEVIAALDNLPEPDLEKRTDLRDIPLITIDPPDARDHDDAVWAGLDDDPQNEGGHVAIVAIADVAAYVRSGSVLDKEALKRGNSVYFPDRVVPMLPEKISNDLCSLRENEDRLCLAVRLRFDKNGNKIDHQFMRAIMRSHAKLSYLQAQKAIDGVLDDKTEPLLKDVLLPLFATWRALKKAQEKRAPLNLDLPERKIQMNDEGHIERIYVPDRLDAHRLIEEFMIQANVAAAQALLQKNMDFVYRVHEPPNFEKLQDLKRFLGSMDISLDTGGSVKAGNFNHILAAVEGKSSAELVNTVILRSQSQAIYATDNRGHFGLNLKNYGHFTSPIRRYADLLVHRALITGMKFGPDGQQEDERVNLAEIASNISDLERRAMAAERETVDRLVAHFLSERTGENFQARISGVTRVGLFVRLAETGADGFIPARTIGDEYFVYDEKNHALIGEHSHTSYQLGDSVDVKLVSASPAAGALQFEMITEGQKREHLRADKAHRSGPGRPGRRGRPGSGPRKKVASGRPKHLSAKKKASKKANKKKKGRK